MSIFNSKEGDYSLGEFAKIAKSTKLYEDKFKLARIAKYHSNSLIKIRLYLSLTHDHGIYIHDYGIH